MAKNKITELNKAIEEAIQFGFTQQLVLMNGKIKRMFSAKKYPRQEFAIVKTYPIKGNIGTISYVVLSDCTLGYIIKEKKYGKLSSVEKHDHIQI